MGMVYTNRMEKRTNLLPVFIGSLVIVVCIVFLGALGTLTFLRNGISWTVFSTSQLFSASLAHFSEDSSAISSLKKENRQLTLQLVKLQTLEADNKALRDQFQTESISSQTLLPATVVGRPYVVPNISFPENFVINVGQKNGIKIGMAVIADNMIVGTISQTSDYYSQVSLVSSKTSSFAGKDSNAIGVVKGQGNGDILFENVLLSQELKVGDMIVTSGNQDISGIGYPPNILIGKITGVEKNPSDLYQRARVKTLLSLDTLSNVFVLTGQ